MSVLEHAFAPRADTNSSRTRGGAGRRTWRRLGAVGLTAAATLLIASPMAQAATLPPALQQMLQAMSSVHSYKMTMDISSAGAGASKTHVVAIYIRNGKALSFDMKMQTSTTGGKPTNIEMVLEGSRLCMKGITGPAWSCSTNTAMAASFQNLGDLTKTAENLQTGTSMKFLGQKTVQGQDCDGYAFTSKTATSSASGMMWANTSSHLLVEEDVVTTTVVAKGAKPTADTVKLVVSNYNDPSLTLSKV